MEKMTQDSKQQADEPVAYAYSTPSCSSLPGPTYCASAAVHSQDSISSIPGSLELSYASTKKENDLITVERCGTVYLS
jgi:hypothetical protein